MATPTTTEKTATTSPLHRSEFLLGQQVVATPTAGETVRGKLTRIGTVDDTEMLAIRIDGGSAGIHELWASELKSLRDADKTPSGRTRSVSDGTPRTPRPAGTKAIGNLMQDPLAFFEATFNQLVKQFGEQAGIKERAEQAVFLLTGTKPEQLEELRERRKANKTASISDGNLPGESLPDHLPIRFPVRTSAADATDEQVDDEAVAELDKAIAADTPDEGEGDDEYDEMAEFPHLAQVVEDEYVDDDDDENDSGYEGLRGYDPNEFDAIEPDFDPEAKEHNVTDMLPDFTAPATGEVTDETLPAGALDELQAGLRSIGGSKTKTTKGGTRTAGKPAPKPTTASKSTRSRR